MAIETSKFIFDCPKDQGLNRDMLQRAIAYWAIELNDRNQFLNDNQYKFLKSAYRATDEDVEEVCYTALNILEYSGIIKELIVDGQILNDVRCTLDDDFGEIILEWL